MYDAVTGSKTSEALAAAGLMTGFDFGGDPNDMTQFIEKEIKNYQYPKQLQKVSKKSFQVYMGCYRFSVSFFRCRN